jgi:hypothetical protein
VSFCPAAASAPPRPGDRYGADEPGGRAAAGGVADAMVIAAAAAAAATIVATAVTVAVRLSFTIALRRYLITGSNDY